MARLVIFNPNATITTIGTVNYALTPVTLTTSTPIAGSSTGSPSGSPPSTTPTSTPVFNPKTLHNTNPAQAAPLSPTGSISSDATSTSTTGSPASTALASSVSTPSSHVLAIALGIVIPLIVIATILAIVMHRRRVRKNHQSAIDAMTIVPPSLELPSSVERRRPGSHVLSWLSLPTWRASVGGTTAMRPGFKSGEPQLTEEKGREVDERLDSPRDVPRYVSGDWRFTNSNDNENRRSTANAERDRLVLVNGRLALWTDHSQHT